MADDKDEDGFEDLTKCQRSFPEPSSSVSPQLLFASPNDGGSLCFKTVFCVVVFALHVDPSILHC